MSSEAAVRFEMPLYLLRAGTFVGCDPDTFEHEEVTIPVRAWREMGEPRVVTVTVEARP